jgi:hypothetical protein
MGLEKQHSTRFEHLRALGQGSHLSSMEITVLLALGRMEQMAKDTARRLEQSLAERRNSAKSWFEADPDIVKRRVIIFQNPRFKASQYCTVFDGRGLSLPGNWRNKYKVETWKAAYQNKRGRAAIDRLISEDKKANKSLRPFST